VSSSSTGSSLYFLRTSNLESQTGWPMTLASGGASDGTRRRRGCAHGGSDSRTRCWRARAGLSALRLSANPSLSQARRPRHERGRRARHKGAVAALSRTQRSGACCGTSAQTVPLGVRREGEPRNGADDVKDGTIRRGERTRLRKCAREQVAGPAVHVSGGSFGNRAVKPDWSERKACLPERFPRALIDRLDLLGEHSFNVATTSLVGETGALSRLARHAVTPGSGGCMTIAPHTSLLRTKALFRLRCVIWPYV
jgi:hypothetical protein